MSDTQSCQPCCSDTTPVNVPGVPGATGDPGTDGTNGTNAYTTTSATLAIPAVGDSQTIQLVNSSWMVIGQTVFIGDGTLNTHWQYTVDLGSNQVSLKFLGYEGDNTSGTLADGAKVSPSGVQPPPSTSTKYSDFQSVLTRPEAFEITTAITQLEFGGTKQQILLVEPGTYMLKARVRVDFSFAETDFAADGTDWAEQKLDMVLKVTNVGPAPGDNVQDSLTTFIMPSTGTGITAYQTLGWLNLPPVFYATAASTDTIGIFAQVGKLPENTTDGKIMAFESSLVAVRVSDDTSL